MQLFGQGKYVHCFDSSDNSEPPQRAMDELPTPLLCGNRRGLYLVRLLSWSGKNAKSRILGYIATISFALYVIHGSLRHTWLGTGDTLEKYAKRPILLGLTFALAHISTFSMESRFIKLSKNLAARTK